MTNSNVITKNNEEVTAVNCNFAVDVGKDFDPDPQDNVFDSLLYQYERVIFQSIITSFGLDFIVNDKRGGDVDTIHNVRNGVEYKSAANKAAYESRGEYNSTKYHSDSRYINANRQYKEQREAGKLKDSYTGEKLAPNESHDLDHVISGRETHDDPGRVLSGLNGVDLANSPENLKATNYKTNRSKGAKSMDEFLESSGDKYTNEQKARMRRANKKARVEYDRKINDAYYSSPKFWSDTGAAAAKVGVGMGLRQTLGFVMTEVWFAVKDALAKSADGFSEKLKAIAAGIKRGFERAKDKFKELLSKFGEGAVAGIISSLVTTLCNIFFTTAKNLVRVIRQTWASIVEAAKILIFNPDNLPFSQRMKAALKVIAAGASVVIGTFAQEAVHAALLPHVGLIPVLGAELVSIISVFAGSLCTGFLTVTLLYFIDNDPFSGFLTKQFDKVIANYKHQAKLFAEYAAKLQELDIETFELESKMYLDLACKLETAKDNTELNKMLKQAVQAIGVCIPWGEDRTLDEFMDDPNAKLCFNA